MAERRCVPDTLSCLEKERCSTRRGAAFKTSRNGRTVLSAWTGAHGSGQSGEKRGGTLWIHHAGEPHPTSKVCLEIGTAHAVLALEAGSRGVVEDRAKRTQFGSRDGGAVVDGQAGHLLTPPSAHHAGLAGVLGQPLGLDDRTDASEQPADGP